MSLQKYIGLTDATPIFYSPYHSLMLMNNQFKDLLPSVFYTLLPPQVASRLDIN